MLLLTRPLVSDLLFHRLELCFRKLALRVTLLQNIKCDFSVVCLATASVPTPVTAGEFPHDPHHKDNDRNQRDNHKEPAKERMSVPTSFKSVSIHHRCYTIGLTRFVLFCHSCESRNPVYSHLIGLWIPAFA